MHSFYIIFFLNQGQQFFYIYLHNKLILPCLRKEQYFQKMKICEGLNDIKWSEYIKIAKKKEYYIDQKSSKIRWRGSTPIYFVYFA